jgi:hypothetical protein
MIDKRKSMKERNKHRFPLEFNAKKKNTTKRMKVTSTIEKCIFVPMAEKKEVDTDGNRLLTHKGKHILLCDFVSFFSF